MSLFYFFSEIYIQNLLLSILYAFIIFGFSLLFIYKFHVIF